MSDKKLIRNQLKEEFNKYISEKPQPHQRHEGFIDGFEKACDLIEAGEGSVILNLKTKQMKKMLLFSSPLILAVEFYCFSWIAELLRQQSDVAVLIGIALTCGFITGNYFLLKYLLTKKTTK